jgi:beta-galactosidase/beta-glucuronidase
MMKKYFFLLSCVLIFCETEAQQLPLRTGLSLNGRWNFTPDGEKQSTITVPDYWDAVPDFRRVKQADYERQVTIPNTPEWQNKVLKLDFEGVNFITTVFVNNQEVGSHVGGWVPFSVDISGYVKPGETFVLKVNVKGGNIEPIVDKNGGPLWPVGLNGQMYQWGIIFDVWLRAYGPVYTEETFIQTSYRQKKIKVDYSLTNKTEKEQKFSVRGTVSPVSSPQHPSLLMNSEPVILKAGETKVVSIEKAWVDPDLWSPANPSLYYLETVLVDKAGKELDKERRRFGFREVWTEGNKLMFNGHPFTILGTNMVQFSEYSTSQRYYYMMPENWQSTIDRLFELNLNAVRFHMNPVPKYILDIADERGLLVVDESAIYAREYSRQSNKEEYMKNSKLWIESWVKGHRNHPSVVIWNAENEMGVGWLKWMTSAEMKSLGDEIRKYDTTRPVNYDGDQDVGDAMVNYHYPEGYAKSVDSILKKKSTLYAWADKVYPDKPTGVGEFITHYGVYGARNQWWMGTWVRGMRYTNFADIRPYRHDWAILRSDNTPQTENLRKSLSPVAVFDLEYDNLGIDPLINKTYPVLSSGDTTTRRLVLYNDAFEDSQILVEVVVKSSEFYQAVYNYNGDRTPRQVIVAEGSKTYNVPLGTHVDIDCTFMVPNAQSGGSDYVDLELIARKKGVVKFRESYHFQLRSARQRGTIKDINSEIILLSEAKKPKF